MEPTRIFQVVEAQEQIARDDVDRAFARANTLRGAGIDAVPVVIGDRWTSDKVRTRAEMRGVEWYAGKTHSEGLIALRASPMTPKMPKTSNRPC